MSYTIVIPMNKEGSDFFFRVGLKTYEQFLDTKLLHRIIIVCPKTDQSYIIENICKSSLYNKITINIDESYIHDDLKVTGWFKQQLIKLVIGEIVSTKYYLVLDSDMYLNQCLTYNDLFHNGKVKYSSEPYQELNNAEYSQNSNWWKNSLDILRLPLSSIKNDKHLMGVTPQVLITSHVKSLIAYLRTQCDNWQQYIVSKKFTEFTLYWLYTKFCLQKEDLYTDEGYPLWKHDHRTNTLSPPNKIQTVLDAVRESFTHPSSYFSVVQGYLKVPTESIEKDIISCLDWSKFRIKEYDAVFLIASCLTANHNQSFDTEQRFQQTLKTVASARKAIPNSFCILIEGSVCSKKHTKAFESAFDIVRWCGNSKEVQHYVNYLSKSCNIGHGECKLLEIGVELLVNYRIKSKHLFKLGARYELTNNFDLKKWDPKKYGFRPHIDQSIKAEVYTTGLYSIPYDRIEEYHQLLKESHGVLDQYRMVERMYNVLIPKELINKVDVLGLKGMLSYNGTLFEK